MVKQSELGSYIKIERHYNKLQMKYYGMNKLVIIVKVWVEAMVVKKFTTIHK